MSTTATPVVVVILLSLVALLILEIVSRGVPKDKNYEIEVGLFPPKIRCKITDSKQE
jgi:hypothetical protein